MPSFLLVLIYFYNAQSNHSINLLAVSRHHGSYVCTASAVAGEEETTDEAEITVDILCKFLTFSLNFISCVSRV